MQTVRKIGAGLAAAGALTLAGCRNRSETTPPTSAAPNSQKPVLKAIRPAPPAHAPASSAANALALAAWKATPDLISADPNQPPRVALTFDAGSDASAVSLILATLKAHHVRATFFLTGKFCEHFPKESRAIADAGMELGNHSYSHPHFTKLSDAAIRNQLTRGEAAITKICGRGTRPLFRFPYGDSDRRTCRTVASAGYQPIRWALDSLDAFGERKSADFVAARINNRVKPGYITLMHVSAIGTAQALPRIFAHLDAMGAQVVPVSDLLLQRKPASAVKKLARSR